MISISRHLSQLLINHDCVIVPELGGFIAHYVPAHFVEEENLYYPPYRTVGFNSQLTLNDGLLVQSVMQTYDVNYPEAVKMVEDAVGDLRSMLLSESTIELEGIGHIAMNLEGALTFTPTASAIQTPALYGLNAIETSDAVSPEMRIAREKQKTSYTISISKRAVNYVAAAVFAAFVCIPWIGSMGSGAEGNVKLAEMFHTSSLFSFTADETVPAAQRTEKDAGLAKPTETPETKLTETSTDTKAAETEKTSSADEATYRIVISCGLPKDYADRFLLKLSDEERIQAEAVLEGSYYTIFYGRYADADAAEASLKMLKADARFASAWIKPIATAE